MGSLEQIHFYVVLRCLNKGIIIIPTIHLELDPLSLLWNLHFEVEREYITQPLITINTGLSYTV